jgi:hypothetical protein
MQAFVRWRRGAALAALAAGMLAVACSLTTDLVPLSAGDAEHDGDAGPPEAGVDTGPPTDSGAGADADASPDEEYRTTVMADGPVAYYRFEDPDDASSASDELAAHAATLTDVGATFGKPGIRGRAVALDGNTSFDVGDSFDFAGQVPFTLEAWIAPVFGPGHAHLFHKRDESVPSFTGYILYLVGEDRSLHFEAWGADMNAVTEQPVPASGFVHVVLVVSYAGGKGNAAFFVNGQPTGNGGYDNTRDLPDTPRQLRLAAGYAGTLDEVAIYDKALTADRILAHHRAGRR